MTFIHRARSFKTKGNMSDAATTDSSMTKTKWNGSDPPRNESDATLTDDEEATECRQFGNGLLNLVGRRTHEVREFMSRLRAQEMSQAYEQGKTGDYDLNKLSTAVQPKAVVGSVMFGPCMTSKQAMELIQTQQKPKLTGGSPEEMSKDKENCSRIKSLQTDKLMKQQHTRQTAHAANSFGFPKRGTMTAWKASEMERHSKGDMASKSEMLTIDSSPASSDASVASTEPESPMSCADDLSVFC